MRKNTRTRRRCKIAKLVYRAAGLPPYLHTHDDVIEKPYRPFERGIRRVDSSYIGQSCGVLQVLLLLYYEQPAKNSVELSVVWETTTLTWPQWQELLGPWPQMPSLVVALWLGIYHIETWTKWLSVRRWRVNSLAPGRFEQNFRKVIFKLNSVTVGWCISCKIALKWVPLDITDDK